MELVDPRSEQLTGKARPAPRFASLAGKRIGILSNGKRHADTLALATARRFEQHHGCRVVEVIEKPHGSKPCPAEDLQKLSEVCEFLITTVGD